MNLTRSYSIELWHWPPQPEATLANAGLAINHPRLRRPHPLPSSFTLTTGRGGLDACLTGGSCRTACKSATSAKRVSTGGRPPWWRGDRDYARGRTGDPARVKARGQIVEGRPNVCKENSSIVVRIKCLAHIIASHTERHHVKSQPGWSQPTNKLGQSSYIWDPPLVFFVVIFECNNREKKQVRQFSTNTSPIWFEDLFLNPTI